MAKDQLTLKSEDVLFRIWLYNQPGQLEDGVIDLMRKRGGANPFFGDSLECKIQEDEYGILRLASRERERDLPEEWSPLIETKLLAPISTKAIFPCRGYVFGVGRLCQVVDTRFHFSEMQLQDVNIISPKEFQKRGGGLIGDDWPDNYESKPPTVFLCHSKPISESP